MNSIPSAHHWHRFFFLRRTVIDCLTSLPPYLRVRFRRPLWQIERTPSRRQEILPEQNGHSANSSLTIGRSQRHGTNYRRTSERRTRFFQLFQNSQLAIERQCIVSTCPSPRFKTGTLPLPLLPQRAAILPKLSRQWAHLGQEVCHFPRASGSRLQLTAL